jgi:hypothetical protein
MLLLSLACNLGLLALNALGVVDLLFLTSFPPTLNNESKTLLLELLLFQSVLTIVQFPYPFSSTSFMPFKLVTTFCLFLMI